MAETSAERMPEREPAPELGEDRLRRLLEVGRSLVSELDLETVLQQVLETAKELTTARYAALGILHRERQELERFLYLGIDEETRQRIGPLPRGKGVLGELIDHPATLRLADVSRHPRSYGFPAMHPKMTTFLGTPVTIRGTAYGNIYLTEKEGGREFDDADEELIVVLAEWASIAIDNARMYEATERQRAELERAVQGLEANVALTRETSGETGLEWLLELIAKRGRGLVDARALIVLLPREGELVAVEAAGELPDAVRGSRVPAGEGEIGAALRGGHTGTTAPDAGSAVSLGLDPAPGLLAPLRFRGNSIGMLAAFGALDPRAEFTPEDALLLDSFAASAASAIGTAQAVEEEKLRLSIESSEAERRRWAMELHDETLQQLGAMKLMNESALQTAEPDAMRNTLERSVAQIEDSIASLEGLITELRPAALDELGAAPALEALIDRLSTADTGLEYRLELDLAFDAGRESTRLAPEMEATIYRIVQEALNNVHKHASASTARIAVLEDEEHVLVTVSDDGRGFDPAVHSGERFGLVGMRERVKLARGELTIESKPGEGTRVSARLPARRVEGKDPA